MKLLISIVPKKYNDAVSAIVGERGIDFQTTVPASGTATSQILECLSLEATDKNVLLSLVGDDEVTGIFEALRTKLNFLESGKGVAFTVSIESMTKLGYKFVKARLDTEAGTSQGE